MSANPMRRVAIATAAAILIGSSVAAATSAAPPPEANTWYACQTISAGYSPGAGGNASAWVWDGRLQWELCVAQTSTGRHYAIARLSSPADLMGPFNKFSQLVHVQLWKCTSSGLVKVAQADWSVANTETATKIGNRYYFRWIQTPSDDEHGDHVPRPYGGVGSDRHAEQRLGLLALPGRSAPLSGIPARGQCLGLREPVADCRRPRAAPPGAAREARLQFRRADLPRPRRLDATSARGPRGDAAVPRR